MGNRYLNRSLFILIALLHLSCLTAAVWLLREKGGAGVDRKSPLLGALQKDAVGLIRIHGPIQHGSDSYLFRKGPVERTVSSLKEMADKAYVKAIVLHINSPGGSVGAVQEIYEQVLRIRKEKKKPVVASFGDVAASGGYYIASACDRIVSLPGSLTGSIGVLFEVGNIQGLMQKIGVRTETIKSGQYKDIASPTRPMGLEEKKLLQELIENTYQQFFEAVLKGRNLAPEKLKLMADGRIFTGQQALRVGLVDQLGNSQTAIEAAAKLANIRGQPRVVETGSPWEPFVQILESLLPLQGLRTWMETYSAGSSRVPQLHYQYQG